MNAWFAVHTHPREELKASLNLIRQGYAVYLPRYLKLRRHARRVERVQSPLFPRYLFVFVDQSRQSWSAIRSTFGVSQLVSNGLDPVEVPQSIIEAIRARENEEGLVALSTIHGFVPGDPVRIVDGPLIDHQAIFDCMADADRVVVLLELLGRKLRTKVPLEALATV
jgi:transcriptional antiterminator RfaH